MKTIEYLSRMLDIDESSTGEAVLIGLLKIYMHEKSDLTNALYSFNGSLRLARRLYSGLHNGSLDTQAAVLQLAHHYNKNCDNGIDEHFVTLLYIFKCLYPVNVEVNFSSTQLSSLPADHLNKVSIKGRIDVLLNKLSGHRNFPRAILRETVMLGMMISDEDTKIYLIDNLISMMSLQNLPISDIRDSIVKLYGTLSEKSKKTALSSLVSQMKPDQTLINTTVIHIIGLLFTEMTNDLMSVVESRLEEMKTYVSDGGSVDDKDYLRLAPLYFSLIELVYSISQNEFRFLESERDYQQDVKIVKKINRLIENHKQRAHDIFDHCINFLAAELNSIEGLSAFLMGKLCQYVDDQILLNKALNELTACLQRRALLSDRFLVASAIGCIVLVITDHHAQIQAIKILAKQLGKFDGEIVEGSICDTLKSLVIRLSSTTRQVLFDALYEEYTQNGDTTAVYAIKIMELDSLSEYASQRVCNLVLSRLDNGRNINFDLSYLIRCFGSHLSDEAKIHASNALLSVRYGMATMNSSSHAMAQLGAHVPESMREKFFQVLMTRLKSTRINQIHFCTLEAIGILGKHVSDKLKASAVDIFFVSLSHQHVDIRKKAIVSFTKIAESSLSLSLYILFKLSEHRELLQTHPIEYLKVIHDCETIYYKHKALQRVRARVGFDLEGIVRTQLDMPALPLKQETDVNSNTLAQQNTKWAAATIITTGVVSGGVTAFALWALLSNSAFALQVSATIGVSVLSTLWPITLSIFAVSIIGGSAYACYRYGLLGGKQTNCREEFCESGQDILALK